MAPRFLVVEDDPTNLILLRTVLSRAPDAPLREASLTAVGTLAAARRAVAADPFDLVLLDVRLPDGNGLDLARDIRASGLEPQPRILVLSASVLEAERDAALDAGGDHFLAKPYLPGELQRACMRLLA
jgi:CheY-like chemotaxis protein